MSYENIDDGREVKVRKKHYCEWCGEKINKGDKAIKRTYKFEGDLQDSRQHPECYIAMKEDDKACTDGFEPMSMPRP